MSEGKIEFFIEGVNLELEQEAEVKEWLVQTIQAHQKTPGEITIIFCDDEYLLSLNRQFLNHDYYTDILTFPLSDTEEIISGDIYISIERVRENALTFAENTTDELHRVMVHGLLHLIGFEDETNAGKEEMRQHESYALSMRMF